MGEAVAHRGVEVFPVCSGKPLFACKALVCATIA